MTDRSVVVAVITYRRPEMVGRLLRSLAELERPLGWDVRFLVVDNDPEGSAESAVTAASLADLAYVVESWPGIPFARNRALDEAEGARLLCFLDDDEVTEGTWLVEMIGHFEATEAVLIGGPVYLRPPDGRLSLWQSFFAASLVARKRFLFFVNERMARLGRAKVTSTANWLCDLEWIRSKGLSFDNRLQFTGGSDRAFYLEVRKRGGKISWCSHSVACEDLLKERLAVGYQWRRAYSQAIVQAGLSSTSKLQLLLTQPAIMMLGFALMVVPVFGVGSFSLGLERAGRAFGKLSYVFGAQSRLYERSD